MLMSDTPAPAVAAKAHRWLVPLSGTDAADVQLFCFHHAGGSASSFARFASAWPFVQAIGVDLPGRAGSPGCAETSDLDVLVDALLAAFLSFRGRAGAKPFVFYGHSLGALVAFELARALRVRGQGLPARLVVSGRRAPSCPLRAAALWDRDDDALIDALRRMGGMSASLLRSPKWCAFVLPPLRADLRLSDEYRYRDAPPLPLPIDVFRGRRDPILAADEVQAWARESTCPGTVAALAGAHFFDEDGTRELKTHLHAWLRRCVVAAELGASA